MPADSPRPASPLDSLVRTVRTVLAPIASLKITVVLFILSGLLVFFGTLAQKGQGVWTVVDSYFYSWLVWVDCQYLVEFGKVFIPGVRPDATTESWPAWTRSFPFPAGKLLGWLMVVNLTAAHILQFVALVDGVRKQAARTRSTTTEVLALIGKRAGIYVLHAGVMLLLVGEYVTREFAVEQQMTIDEGGSSSVTVDTKRWELAFVDGSAADVDKVAVVPLSRLVRAAQRHERITHPDLPADLEVLREYKNSRPVKAEEMPDNPATAGEGQRMGLKKADEVAGVDMTKEVDMPAVYVKVLKKGTDEAVGVYLMTPWADDQPIKLGDTTYTASLRRTHYYKPYTLHLNQFRFDRYIGTETARNYSSEVRLEDPGQNEDRTVTIRMNEPLRHRGDTLYQADFDKKTEKTTILQVVSNPGADLPYISCVLVAFGMLLHFVIKLVQFLVRARAGVKTFPTTGPTPAGAIDLTARSLSPLARYGVPVAAATVAVLLLAGLSVPRKPTKDRLDLQKLATLPVVDGGRVKPLDTVARVDLRLITNAEEFTDTKGVKRPALQWFLDTAVTSPGTEDGPAAWRVFRIENQEVLSLLKLQPREGLRYSLNELRPEFKAFFEESRKAFAQRQADPKSLGVYQSKLIELHDHVIIYQEVMTGGGPLVIPPDGDQGWQQAGAASEKAEQERMTALQKALPRLRERLAAEGVPPNLQDLTPEQKETLDRVGKEELDKELPEWVKLSDAWEKVLMAYRDNDPKAFDTAVADYRKLAAGHVPAGDQKKVELETFLNQSSLYYWCTVLYGVAGVGALIGFVLLLLAPKASQSIRRGVFWWLVVTFLAHTFTLFARMYLMDRPLVFVTNLYSSAVFIGWAVMALCLILELVFPIGFGNLVAAVLGFATCIIAHNLAASGDTLEMMQAVLDTNFWLATHVTSVTLGYSATYAAGKLGLIYVILYMFPEQSVLRKRVTIGSGVHALTWDIGKILGTLLYAVICFATLFSFVGTVLGGIWADQSWGRFWGWDPKENGAVLIVLWNVLILHARWGGLVKERGMAVLAVVGIAVTTWSWFGTNQLGVGLHAYGFNNGLVKLCDGVWVGSALAVLVGVLPWQWVYRGGQPAPPPVATRA